MSQRCTFPNETQNIAFIKKWKISHRVDMQDLRARGKYFDKNYRGFFFRKIVSTKQKAISIPAKKSNEFRYQYWRKKVTSD